MGVDNRPTDTIQPQPHGTKPGEVRIRGPGDDRGIGDSPTFFVTAQGHLVDPSELLVDAVVIKHGHGLEELRH